MNKENLILMITLITILYSTTIIQADNSHTAEPLTRENVQELEFTTN